ncbi:ergosterol biosynthesis protein [Apiotrichum porosum]|uniref:Ergosterol biosynthesis protein n=1 Tax=Apiotrichum porosum TaxID=105984 RepID=A0A427Y594_9TREE|nr:ergosterol biosynthesis protein [Apiotrichum porosum]RSH86256.1 ergosterol biosynthesis protein [Apiotrichum porosum]
MSLPSTIVPFTTITEFALNMAAYLPTLPADGGLLPYWLLITSAASVYNVAQNYVTLKQSKEVYGGKPDLMNPLAGRLFGAWTAMAAVVRALAAYDISNPGLYTLAICAFGVATFHFGTEWLIFGTVKLNRASIGPLLVGSSGVVWMLTQRSYYLGL